MTDTAQFGPSDAFVAGRHRGFIHIPGRGLFDRFNYAFVAPTHLVSPEISEAWYGSLKACVFPATPAATDSGGIAHETPKTDYVCPACGFRAETANNLVTHVMRDRVVCAASYPHYRCFGACDMMDEEVLDMIGIAVARAEAASGGAYNLLLVDTQRFSKRTALFPPHNDHYGIYLSGDKKGGVTLKLLPRAKLLGLAGARGVATSTNAAGRPHPDLLQAPSTLILVYAEVTGRTPMLGTLYSEMFVMCVNSFLVDAARLAGIGNKRFEALVGAARAKYEHVHTEVDPSEALLLEPNKDAGDLTAACQLPTPVEDVAAYRSVDPDRRRDAIAKQLLSTSRVTLVVD